MACPPVHVTLHTAAHLPETLVVERTFPAGRPLGVQLRANDLSSEVSELGLVGLALLERIEHCVQCVGNILEAELFRL